MEKFLKPIFYKKNKGSKDNQNIERFVLEKLERGFGNTLGTSLRRTILSSIPGAGIFAIEITNVFHEFQTIPNVKEDVVEIVLNLKEMNIEVDEAIIDPNELYEFKLKSGIGEIKFGDIETPEGFEITNKDFVFANSLKSAALEIIFHVNYSKGYKSFDENQIFIEETLGSRSNIIAIDSNYSPISRVNYFVEDVNPGESKVYERLILEVETKGNILPNKVIAFAASILINYLKAFENLTEIKMDQHFEEEKEVEEKDAQLLLTIDSLNLSVRSENALKAAGVFTVDQLIDRPVSSLREIKNLGEKSKSEIIQVIQDLGLSFKSE